MLETRPDAMTVTRLLIARHGNTFASGDIVTRVGGRTDLPLVPSGREQGQQLGLFLRQSNFLPDKIYTSTLKRAIETAEHACAAMNHHPPIDRLDIFNEIDYGPDENQPEDDVIARIGAQALKDWDEHAIVPDGWDVDPEAIIQGWHAFAEQICRNNFGQTILVVTSNGIARFSPHLTGNFDGFRQKQGLKIATGAVCLFTHSGPDEKTPWECQGWNWRPKNLTC